MKLDELDSMMDDVLGSLQQLEADILAIDVSPDDPKCLETRINTVQVCTVSTSLPLSTAVPVGGLVA